MYKFTPNFSRETWLEASLRFERWGDDSGILNLFQELRESIAAGFVNDQDVKDVFSDLGINDMLQASVKEYTLAIKEARENNDLEGLIMLAAGAFECSPYLLLRGRIIEAAMLVVLENALAEHCINRFVRLTDEAFGLNTPDAAPAAEVQSVDEEFDGHNERRAYNSRVYGCPGVVDTQ